MSLLLANGSHLGRLRGLVAKINNRANQYTMNTWSPSTAPIGSLGGTGEAQVRPSAAAAFGIAAAIACGTHDPAITGKTETEAIAAAVRLIDGVAHNHVAVGGDGWGNGWQTALWAWLAGYAGWLLWDELGATLQGQVTAMVVHEANRQIDRALSFRNSGGDTWLEEGSWDVAVVILALGMSPTHANANAWRREVVRHTVACAAKPADVNSSTLPNGLVGSVITGYNIEAEGYARNHNIIHPDYMTSPCHLHYGAATVWARAGEAVPEAVRHNAGLLYHALVEVEFPSPPYLAPGGTPYIPGTDQFYYPEGNDWGTNRVLDKGIADVFAYRWGWGDQLRAGSWGVRHLNRHAEMQERFTDGHTYLAGAGEDTYPGAEQWVGHLTACGLLALFSPVPTWTNSDWY